MRGLGVFCFINFILLGGILSAQDYPDYNIDLSYGRLNQCDSRLRDLGLFNHKNESALCGPVSICNLLKKFRQYLSLEEAIPETEEVRTLTEDILPWVDIKTHGLQPETIQELIRQYFRSIKIKIRTRIWNQSELPPFFRSLRPDTGMILEFDWWHRSNFNPTNPWKTRYEDGHFVLVAGVHQSDPHRILVLDPWSPDKFFELQLNPAQTDSGRVYYRAEWIGEESPAQPVDRVSIFRAAVELRVVSGFGR